MFYKIGVPKTFPNLTEKYLYLSIFLNEIYCHTIFVTNHHPSFHLWRKEKLVKSQKSQNIMSIIVVWVACLRGWHASLGEVM